MRSGVLFGRLYVGNFGGMIQDGVTILKRIRYHCCSALAFVFLAGALVLFWLGDAVCEWAKDPRR